jgi:hypothetical protein
MELSNEVHNDFFEGGNINDVITINGVKWQEICDIMNQLADKVEAQNETIMELQSKVAKYETPLNVDNVIAKYKEIAEIE